MISLQTWGKDYFFVCLTILFVSSVQFNSYTQIYTPGYSQPPAGNSVNLQLSVWDWDLRYSSEQILQFHNPGYDPEHCPDSWLPRQQVRCLHFLNSLDRLILLDREKWKDMVSEFPRESCPHFCSCHLGVPDYPQEGRNLRIVQRGSFLSSYKFFYFLYTFFKKIYLF